MSTAMNMANKGPDVSNRQGAPFHLRPTLRSFGSRVRSQSEEDGLIAAIFEDIPPVSRFFVEFGIGPAGGDHEYARGLEGNCVLLREQGWQGLMMDGGDHPPELDVRREFITPMNINSLLRKHHVPTDVDLISIDVDGQDFWIWMACQYRPALFILEYNRNFLSPWEAFTVEFNPQQMWDNTRYYGASLGALIKLGRDKDYTLVCENGVNAFFVRNDLLANPQDFRAVGDVEAAEQQPADKRNRAWVAV
jgi:hypothetical protein